MALFDGFRRKRDQPELEAEEIEPDEQEQEAGGFDEAASLYRAVPLNAIAAGDDVLLHDPERAAPIVVPSFELDLLAQCTRFASIESHASAAAVRTGLPADGVVQSLYDFVDRGLLLSLRTVVDRARAAADKDEGATPILDRVAVITSDRPANLETCLRSYRARYGADLELIVFDDSTDPAMRSTNRSIAEKIGGRVRYAGAEEKSKAVTELAARSGVDADVVRAAILPLDVHDYHCGANRNAVLLEAAGGAIVMVDDDTTARAAYPAGAADGLRFSSAYDPWSLHFFPTVSEAIEAAEWTDVDLLEWHQRFLGRSASVCAFGRHAPGAPFELDASTVGLDLDQADGAMVGALSRGRGRVVATSAGIAGDSGMGVPLYFLTLEGHARENLLQDYQAHRATRAVHRAANVPTISNSQLFMGAHVALDARATLPPFPPVLRNSDGVFGALLRACAPESHIGFLPCLVEHNPPDVRPADFDRVVRSVASVRANDIIRDLATSFEPAPGVVDPAVRLGAFGKYLVALGAMPSGDFDALARYQITAAVGRRIDRLTRAVNRNDSQPEQWAKDCEIVVAEGIRALSEDELVVADTAAPAGDEGPRRFQRLVDRFGHVVEAWPALLESARNVRVSVPLS
jgi:hypothetical protein